ncbi:MAG: MFS transporter, partial [Eubacteriales bacterium]
YAVFFTLSYVGISIYRPAATAILPDIIPKPLRSKANAIQGIVTSFGSLLVIGLVAVFGDKNILATYIFSGAFMLLVMLLYLFNINEPKLVREAEAIMARYTGLSDETAEQAGEGIVRDGPKGKHYIAEMPKVERKSLILLILSIAMCAFGFGAMISTYQNYAHEVWGMTHNAATVFMLLFGLGGLVGTPLVIRLSDRKGRKNTMVAGMIFFIAGTAMIIFLQDIVAMRFIGFIVMGLGWTFIIIMAFPMVLEFSNTLNNGIFASIFTLAFNIPKALTSYVSGVMLTRIGYQILFPYTMFFVSIGFILILFVKHGNVTEHKISQKAAG